MAATDPIIPKLLSLKQKNQEQRLSEIQSEMRALRHKLTELEGELANVDIHTDGMGRLSVENGYLRFVQHRQGILRERITQLQGEASEVQNELRQSVFSQSMLRD